MKKQNMNNLFVQGKKLALLAIFTGLTFGLGELFTTLNNIPLKEQPKNEVRVDNEQQEQKPQPNGYLGLVCLCGFATTIWTAMFFIARKMPEEELRKCEKSFTL